MKSHDFQTRSHSLLVWAFLLLSLWIPPSIAQNHLEIPGIPFQESFQMESSETRFYRLTLTNAPKGSDLLISVFPEQESYSPTLFVSNNKEFPQKMDDADFSSISSSGNVILLSYKDLKGTSFLEIGLLCASAQCNAGLFIKWTKEGEEIANGVQKGKDDSSPKMADKSPKIFFGERVEQIYDLDPFEKNYFVYNSTRGISAEITFYAVKNGTEDLQVLMESGLRQGQKLKAQYWLEESSSTDLGKEVYLEAETDPKARSNFSHVILEQKFSLKDSKGKLMVEIVNPWDFNVKFRLFMRPNYVENGESQEFDRDWRWESWNTYDTLQFDSPKLYSINIERQGNWYVWAYSCDAMIDLKVENGDLETGMVTIPKGESYLYKALPSQKRTNGYYGEAENKPHSVILSLNANSSNERQQGKLIMYSAVINGDKFSNYDIKENSLEVNLTQKEEKNEVTVEFEQIEVPWTQIAYKVWLCPNSSGLALESLLCNRDLFSEKCKESELQSPKNPREKVKVDFQDVDYGIHFVKIKAIITEQLQVIKIAEPYLVGYVDVKNPIFWKIFKVFVGVWILAVVIVLGLKGYDKFKERQETKGLELQKVENTMEGYNPLEDEGESPKIQQNESGVIEVSDGE